MALVEMKEKTTNKMIQTRYHQYYFNICDSPKVLDLFDTDLKGLTVEYGDGIGTTVNGIKVNAGFYLALQDFINKYDKLLVKLTPEEERFFKENVPVSYKLYLEKHKGIKLPSEQEEDLMKALDEPKKKKK